MNKFCKYSLGIAAVALMSACSDDVLEDGGKGAVSEENQTLYVSMNIIGDSPTGSRAAADNGYPGDGDFEDGTHGSAGDPIPSENLINNAYFVFYDEDGEVVGDIVPVELDDKHISETLIGNTVEKSYKSVVAVGVKKGEKMPTQVICYINPISPSTLQNPLNIIQTISRTSAWSTIGGGDTKYFAMSNSVYYPRGAASADKDLPQVAVPIPEGYLYQTEAEAEKALGTENTLNIYVERYATKLQFEAKNPTAYKTATRVYKRNADDNGYVTTVGSSTTPLVTLSFTPQYWAVNAESNRTYVIKSFRQESAQGEILADNYTFDGLNARINPNSYNENDLEWNYGEGASILSPTDRWNWNAPDNHRSYWGMSPAYFTSEYPEVSSDLKDITVNQKYISYNELKTPNNGIGFAATNTAPQYFRETTVSYRALNSNNPNAAVASVIYVGQYNLNIAGAPDVPAGTSFYTYLSGNVPDAEVEEDRPYIYFNTTRDNPGTVKSDVAGGESMLLRFFAQATILYRKSTKEEQDAGGGEYTRLSITRDSDINKMVAALKVSEISDEVKVAYDGKEDTKLKLQNNARSLQFISAQAASDEGIYIVTGGGYMQIVADDAPNFNSDTQVRLTEANLTLMRQVGLSYYYTTGHAYYSIPVKHFGWYRKGNRNYYNEDGTKKENARINWNIVRVGDFGMVRNHSYQVHVQEIVGLASGIGDDDNPIVPPANTTDYFMAYSVNILKWAVVPVQDVNL